MLLRQKEDIKKWLKTYDIQNTFLVKDDFYGYVVNVLSNVNLNNKNLKTLEVKFNEIHGSFDIKNNYLTNFEGFPEIVHRNLNVFNNKITSLKNATKKIEGLFHLSNNELTIEGLNNLDFVVKSDIIFLKNNKFLEKFQEIEKFSKLKESLLIYRENENILNSINKNNLNKNKIINKI